MNPLIAVLLSVVIDSRAFEACLECETAVGSTDAIPTLLT
jgi:hypothetical protein